MTDEFEMNQIKLQWFVVHPRSGSLSLHPQLRSSHTPSFESPRCKAKDAMAVTGAVMDMANDPGGESVGEPFSDNISSNFLQRQRLYLWFDLETNVEACKLL